MKIPHVRGAFVEGVDAYLLAIAIDPREVERRLAGRGVRELLIERALLNVEAIKLEAEQWKREQQGRVRQSDENGNAETEMGHKPASSDAMTVTEAAQALDLTPRRVRQLIKAGELSAHRDRGAWRLDPTLVAEVGEERERRER